MRSAAARFALKLTFGFGVLALLLYFTDLLTVSSALSRIDLWALASLPVFYLNMLIKTLRWKVYLESHGVKLSLRAAFSIYMNGTFLGLISPSRVGEVYRAWMLVQHRHASLGIGVASVFIDRVSDLIGFAGLGFFGFLYLVDRGFGAETTPAILAILAGPAARGTQYLRRSFQRIADRVPRGEGRNLADEYADFVQGIRRFSTRLLAAISLLTLLSIGVYAGQLYFIAYLMGLPLNFIEVVAVLCAATFINVLPISVFGIGTRDAFMVAALPLLGVSRDLALAYSLTFTFLFLANTVMALPFWLFSGATRPALEPPPAADIS